MKILFVGELKGRLKEQYESARAEGHECCIGPLEGSLLGQEFEFVVYDEFVTTERKQKWKRNLSAVRT